MNVVPGPTFRPSTESQVEPVELRAGQAPRAPTVGKGSTGENERVPAAPSVTPLPQDEVRVQWDTSDQTVIYQFVNQQGTLVLQVPSEQMLSLARQISQELDEAAAPREPAATEGEKSDGN